MKKRSSIFTNNSHDKQISKKTPLSWKQCPHCYKEAASSHRNKCLVLNKVKHTNQFISFLLDFSSIMIDSSYFTPFNQDIMQDSNM